jgi:hypothetical protein
MFLPMMIVVVPVRNIVTDIIFCLYVNVFIYFYFGRSLCFGGLVHLSFTFSIYLVNIVTKILRD